LQVTKRADSAIGSKKVTIPRQVMSDLISDYSRRDDYVKAYSNWLAGLSDWKILMTLTFDQREKKYDITFKDADKCFRWFLRVLNKDLFGNNYRRIVGHSYFGYVVSFERTTKGFVHMHVLCDDRINWSLAGLCWRKAHGRIHIEPITDIEGAAGYVTKYVAKGGDLRVYMPPKRKQPAFKPLWYVGGVEALLVG